MYVVVCYNGMGRCLPKSPSAFTICPSPENRCVLSPLSFYLIHLQEFFFLKWSLAFLYYLFFEMHPLSLALIFHSFCLRFFFIPFIPLVQLSSKYNSAFLHYLLFFCKATLPLCHHFPLFCLKFFFFFLKEVSHFFFHSSFR